MSRRFWLVPMLPRQFGPALAMAWALAGAAQAADDAGGVNDAGMSDVARAHDSRPEARPDSKPVAVLQPQPESPPLAADPPRAEEPAQPAAPEVAPSDFVTGQEPFMAPSSPHRPTRTKAQARLSGLAVMAARIATEANLKAAGTFEAPRDMTNPSERRILVRRPEPTLQPAELAAAPPPASAGVLDESIVKEIVQRKTMFRMCYESARRRGVTVTRADVKWRLSPDGSVRDVVVEVAQDDALARCIRVIASRPFPTRVAEEVPVAIPLLFVSERNIGE